MYQSNSFSPSHLESVRSPLLMDEMTNRLPAGWEESRLIDSESAVGFSPPIDRCNSRARCTNAVNIDVKYRNQLYQSVNVAQTFLSLRYTKLLSANDVETDCQDSQSFLCVCLRCLFHLHPLYAVSSSKCCLSPSAVLCRHVTARLYLVPPVISTQTIISRSKSDTRCDLALCVICYVDATRVNLQRTKNVQSTGTVDLTSLMLDSKLQIRHYTKNNET